MNKPNGTNAYPFYSPRFWHGMRPRAWGKLLKEGGYAVSLSRWPMVVGISLATPFNSLFAFFEQLLFGRRVAQSQLHGPPVFIIGHWRSGTTLLHELLIRDERLSSPSTYQCFAPSHFLVTQWFFRRFATWLLPGKRPMDNMIAGWDRPQEDEFALVNLGLPSPYRRIAFPRRGPVDMNYLDFRGVPVEDLETWMGTLQRFLLRVSYSTARPLVIKSPTHTGRIGELAKAFPQAKFIHLTRDPRALFPSTVRLWRSLDGVQSLQTPVAPKDDGIENYVIDCFRRMYDAFHAKRDEIDPARLIDVRYEDLIDNPVATLERIYDTLRLSDFETVRDDLETWAATEHRDYQTNEHKLAADTESKLREQWREYFQRYGYADPRASRPRPRNADEVG